MIRNIYIFFTVLLVTFVIAGTPFDFISASWHTVAEVTLTGASGFSAFLALFNVIGYIEEKDNNDGDYVKFYLRTAFGLRSVSKIPVIVWFIASGYFVQTNQLLVALGVFLMSLLALSMVLVQNSLYKRYLLEQVTGD